MLPSCMCTLNKSIVFVFVCRYGKPFDDVEFVVAFVYLLICLTDARRMMFNIP